MEAERRTYSRSKSAVQRGQTQDSRASKSSPRKRTYQRENSRKKDWQPIDQSSSSNLNDDLRSPCHKHPRFKGKKDSSPTDKPRNEGPWNKKIESSNAKTVLGNKDFPPLGFNMDRFTPESNKDWGSIVDEEEEHQKTENNQKQSSKENQKPPKFKRRLLLSASDSNESKDKKTENDDEKKKNKVLRPIMTDQHKLAKRQKQIDIGKNTVSYGHYFKNVSRQERSKDDPWTPDKFQQCSTRSWVGQIKVWRRRLHSYDLSSDSKEELFSTSSASSSQATEDISMDLEEASEKPQSIEDMFEGFDLDSCLQDDGYPL